MDLAKIAGVGLYVPDKCVKNEYFNDLYNKDVASFLVKERNIRQRYFMSEDQATSDLILPAAQKALAQAKILAEDIDLIIVATDTPDYLSPSTASVIQFKLGAKHAGTFDINSACSGFVTALDVASKYIATDKHIQNVLVVGAYGMSKYLDWSDYRLATLFADGAGAVVLQRSQTGEGGILASQLFTDGKFHDYMGIYGGGTRYPITPELIEKKGHLLSFAKKIPLETNPTHWPRLANLILDRINKTKKDVKYYFFTQINIKSIQESMTALNEPHEKAFNIMDRYGYTGSACIPMALADAAAEHELKKGDLILLISSGGGVSMAAMAIEWSYDT
jgi:3-oxoacyl-[acyl-carrier-protein] synthase-3